MKNNSFNNVARMLLLVLLLVVAGMMKGYAYNVTIGSISNGTVVANPTTANAGETVTLTATPGVDVASEYFLQSWSVIDGDDNSIAVTQGDSPNIGTFIMPSSDVTVTATFSRTYLLYLLFEDIQTCEDLILDGGGRGDYLGCQQLPGYEALWDKVWYWYTGSLRNEGYLWLAQNEKEGFQVFYGELEKERNLRIEVSPFLNTQNEVLQHLVYYEDFFCAEGMEVANSFVGGSVSDSLAEALIPYTGGTNEIKKTSVGHNKAFFIELKSTKNQTPGWYVSTITVYDGNDVLATRTVYAKVWNFALPENHYSDVVMGLYNRNSGYGVTSSLFKLNGISVDAQGNVAESDLPAAKQILDGYQECLLQHGVNTFEIPRWKMADDPKAAELIMADPRRKVFEVPVHWYDLSGSSFSTTAQSVLDQYKDIAYNNVFLKDKAFFYPMDELDWSAEELVVQFNTVCNALSESWPDYHAIIPFKGNYSQTAEMFEGKIDILCPNQVLLDPYNSNWSIKQANYEDFKDRENHPDRFRTWRYQGNAKSGGTYFWISPLQTSGVMRRIPFWQQYLLNSDGWLHWNCAFLPDNWTKKKLPGGHGAATNNGDGILLYPGTMFGQSAETPIVSLRLKQLASGIDDYDYFRMAEEFLNDEDISEIFSIVYSGEFETNCYMLTTTYPYYYDGWTCQHLQKARYKLGQLLSAANTEHAWGEWQTAVLPDEAHDGLEIRSCSHCGTQESRPKTYSSLYRFVGTEDNQWANLNNWANDPETLPTPGEAVVIAHDCEINSNTTQFYVVVNDGLNLAINEGTTLTAQRITTEGNAQVIVEDGAQLKTMSEGVQATVKKNIAPHNGIGGWHFVSTSLASDVVPSTSNNIVSSTAGNYDLYLFDQSENLEWRNYKVHGFNLENGTGYLYANSEENVSLEFTGTTNRNAQKEFGLAYDANAEFAGWNLVGNPYPCNVYADKNYYAMNEEGTAIYPTPVSIGTAIGPCTGIMVKADGTGEIVTFRKTAPETQGQNKGMLQIKLAEKVLNRDGVSIGSTDLDMAIVSFNEGDKLEKYIFNADNAQLYIPQNGKDYSIAYTEKHGEMSMDFKATKNGIYTITVNHEAVELAYLHLIDNKTGNDVDLLAMPNYTFSATPTDYTSRFRLVFSASEDTDGDNEAFAYFSNGNIIINDVDPDATLQIMDVTGRVIVNTVVMRNISTSGIASGVYVLRLIYGNDVKVQKIVID